MKKIEIQKHHTERHTELILKTIRRHLRIIFQEHSYMLGESEKSCMTDKSSRFENSEKVMHRTIFEVIDNQVSMKICS